MTKRNDDQEVFSSELDWFITARDAACGYRSTLGSVVSTIEHGGAFGEPNTTPYHDGQTGFYSNDECAFAKDRRILPRWAKLTREHQQVLVAYYLGRVDGSAKDKDDIEPIQQAEIARKHGYARPDDTHRKFPLGVSDIFAPFTGVVLFQATSEARIVSLGERKADKSKTLSGDDERSILKAQSRAEDAVRRAHRAYSAIVALETAKPRPEGWRAEWRALLARRPQDITRVERVWEFLAAEGLA